MAPPQLTTPRPSETTRSSVSSPRSCSSKESSRRSPNQWQIRGFPSPAAALRRGFRLLRPSSDLADRTNTFLVVVAGAAFVILWSRAVSIELPQRSVPLVPQFPSPFALQR